MMISFLHDIIPSVFNYWSVRWLRMSQGSGSWGPGDFLVEKKPSDSRFFSLPIATEKSMGQGLLSGLGRGRKWDDTGGAPTGAATPCNYLFQR